MLMVREELDGLNADKAFLVGVNTVGEGLTGQRMVLLYGDSDDEEEERDNSLELTLSSDKKRERNVSFAVDEVPQVLNTQGKMLLAAMDSSDSLNERVTSHVSSF
jgi:hypothetical protein